MKANELRIGNFIEMYITSIPSIHELHLVEPTTLMMIRGDIDCRGVHFVPIKITEEWLSKFDFAGIGTSLNTEYYVLEATDKIDIEVETNPIKVSMSIVCFESGEIKIEYVHQLQNLYFALTGKELTV